MPCWWCPREIHIGRQGDFCCSCLLSWANSALRTLQIAGGMQHFDQTTECSKGGRLGHRLARGRHLDKHTPGAFSMPQILPMTSSLTRTTL